MTKEEAKAYALKVAKESGVTDEVATQIAGAFDNEKFYGAFVPRPEVDRALSGEQQKYAAFKTRNEYLEGEWYPEAKKVHERATAALTRLQKYQETYGDIQDGQDLKKAAIATGMTQEEVLNQISTATSSLGQTYLEYDDIKEDYRERFGKRLPRQDFEKHVSERRKAGVQDSISSLYRDWVGPQADAAKPHRFSEDELKERDKRIKEEALKDNASRSSNPVQSQKRESNIFYNRIESERKGKDNDQASGRDAFIGSFTDPKWQTADVD